jgi:hypothetical protein
MATTAYACDVVAYPCVTLPDGSVGYCHQLSCLVVETARPHTPHDELHLDEHRPSFGVQGPREGALRIPLDALVGVLEQMGATVSFDVGAFRQSAERFLVRPHQPPTPATTRAEGANGW